MRVFFPQIKSVSQVHGKAYKKANQVYLILYHPAAALYQQRLKEVMEEDFKQIKDILKMIEETK